MDAATNPYAPGAGRVPTALAGRDQILSDWATGLRRIEAGRGAQPIALYGLRGVGKTVLLAEFARTARERRWIVARLEASATDDLRRQLGESLHSPLTDLARPSAGKRLLRALKTALSFKASYDTSGVWNFGLDLTDVGGGGADTGVLQTDVRKIVRDVAEAAAEEELGLAILIDEAQDLTREELATLSSVAHEAGQENWSVHLAIAGLPSLPAALADAKSYSERLFNYREIGPLPPDQAERALADPARAQSVTWGREALDYIGLETNGYPYFLQQFGQDTWNDAAGDSSITLADAKVGAATARHALDIGFYRSRWDRATRSEQEYLRAMAVDGDRGSSSAAIGERLGRKTASLGPVRSNLIRKGLIYAPEHGVIAFTVPHMAEFIARQPTQ